MLRVVFVVCLVLLPASLFSGEIKRLCIKDTCLAIEVVTSGQARQKGLMFRNELKPGEGMLFIFEDEAFHTFWMKNMSFPLDFIWVNKEKVIVDLKTNVKPCGSSCPNFTSREKSLYVLEVNSGFVEKHKIKIGERLVF